MSSPLSPALSIEPNKITPEMNESLQALFASLLCPLCNKVFDKPTTLTCAHTFCSNCIESYCCDNWNCPVPGCGFPMTARGGRTGSYNKVNPEISTVVSSFQNICQTINNAPDQWWNTPVPDGLGEDNTMQVEQQDDDDDSMAGFHSPNSENAETSTQQGDCQKDSQKTQAFSVEEQTARVGLEANNARHNVSCIIPSQSPGVSPIALEFSQAEASYPKSPVAFADKSLEEQSKTIPRVLILSINSTKDRELVQTCTSQGRLALVLDELDSAVHVEDPDTRKELLAILQSNDTYAICGNLEVQTGDGYLVKRTFSYLLAVACGLPIVSIHFLETKKERRLFPDPSVDKSTAVIGDEESSNWMAPQRAFDNRNGKGTALLDGYTLFLYGDYDHIACPQRSRKRSSKASDDGKVYSRNRMQCLAEACGARVLPLQDSSDLKGDKVAVLLRPNPHAREWRAALNRVLECNDLHALGQVPVVSGTWLLDSIGNFQVMDFENYVQQRK